MLGSLSLYILGAIAVTLGAGAAPIVLHGMFGATLPPAVQSLADTFTTVFKTGAAVFLGPAQLLRRVKISFDKNEPRSLPSSESNKVPEQVEGGRTLTKLLAAPENLRE
jgi:hypothetical protein